MPVNPEFGRNYALLPAFRGGDTGYSSDLRGLAQMGIGSLVFDPCANRPEQGDFLSVMKTNVAQLRLAF